MLVMLCAVGIASAQTTKKVLELPEFKGIYVNSNYTVYLKQQDFGSNLIERVHAVPLAWNQYPRLFS